MTAASIALSPVKHVPSRWTSAAGLLAAAVVLCACRTSTGVFANLAAAETATQEACQAGEGAGIGGPIPPAALVMLVEATKLLISVVLWNLEERRAQLEQLPGPAGGLQAAGDGALALLSPAEPLLDRRFFLFAPPAALYCSCNVLWLVALQRMAAPVFEMLSTLRIVLSVALACAFTQSGAQLRRHHYAALGMLGLANLVAHWGMDVAVSPRAADILLVLLSIASSAVANMLFELLTKERFLDVSLHLQNLQLYSWGVAFNAATFAAMQIGGGAAAPLSLAWLPCANVWHVLLILVFACVGIVTGIVLKYHGNVASVVAQSFAVHLSALLSHLSIRFTPSWQFLAGAGLCQAAILLYNRDSLWGKKPPS